jgi:peptidoglycan/xylan/chitin deacetylase (PgdA/CDA1 family)
MYTTLPQGLISLTYDDGPGPGTIRLARYLHDQNICATFFVVGNSDAGGGYINYPYLDSLIYYGQRIASHTYNHKDLRTLTCQEVQSQLKMNHLIITPIIKNNLCYFTPPWFSWSKKVADCILSDPYLNGIRGPIGMDFDTQDYLFRNAMHPEICVRKFLDNPVNQNKFNSVRGGIIKMHDFNSYTRTDFALQETKIIVEYLKSKGYTFVAPTLEFSPRIDNLIQDKDFSNDKHWSSNISYYGTIRLKDVNGDKQADLIARDSDGIHVALSNGLGFGTFQLWSSEFSDRLGWKNSKYSSTLQCADVNGDEKSDLVIQCSGGTKVSLSNGSSFEHSKVWTAQFSDLNTGTDQNDIYFRNVRLADVNGDQKADIIVRKQDGIYVALSSGYLFKSKVLWTKEFSDTIQNGWKLSKYNKEIQLADVNGDNIADVIGKSPRGIMVSLSTGTGFLPATLWKIDFSDVQDKNKLSTYNSMRLGDVNGDGRADLLLRERDGIHVLLSNGHEFVHDFIWYKAGIIEQLNWNNPCYNFSFRVDDINGDQRADFIIRSLKGISGAVAP